ncbi:MAG TPA: glycosyltransferase family A protein [Flavisolibacter sp.]|nr:glycosyltransferase family A protein [Flavisolibacter sp.]
MKQFFEMVVVIPVGPGCRPEYIGDTINSLVYYSRSSFKIILADDSHKGTGKRVQEQWPDVDLLPMKAPMGKLCGLYITLSLAFRHALDRYRFDVLLRMDTDALVIGKAPEKEAIALIKSDPGIGIAGQYPFDYNGLPWDISWPKSKLQWITNRKMGLLLNPLPHWRLRKLHRRAVAKGYRTGESVFGGACFYSEACLLALEAAGLLPHHGLRSIKLEEDHLFALLASSIGFRLGDLSSGNLPFGCAWKGLPASPARLFDSGKKIIHSTRFWENMGEEEIRAFFKRKREQPVTEHHLYIS